MTDTWKAIETAASKALVGKGLGQGEGNRYAQDRALRMVRTVDRLAAALGEDRPGRVDLVRVAAMYACVGSDAGRRGPEDDTDDAAELAADQLEGRLSSGDIDLTLRILREHRRKSPELAEARLLADAVALEDVGLVGLWNQTRYFHAQGRTLDQLVKLWRTQQEYGYWEARLRDGFFFAVSRRVATQRLQEMELIFERMRREQAGDDIR